MSKRSSAKSMLGTMPIRSPFLITRRVKVLNGSLRSRRHQHHNRREFLRSLRACASTVKSMLDRQSVSKPTMSLAHMLADQVIKTVGQHRGRMTFASRFHVVAKSAR